MTDQHAIRWTIIKRFCIAMSLLMVVRPALAAGEEWPVVEDFGLCPAQIDEAVGYAACYNPWRVEALCKPIAKDTAVSEHVRARAWWAQALAWGRFCLDYRTARFMDAYRGARQAALLLDPGLSMDGLAELDVSLAFYLEKPDKPVEVLAGYEERLRQHPDESAALYAAGLACFQATEAMKDGKQPAGQARLKTAADRLRAVMEKEPGLYGPASYYVTVANQLDPVPQDLLKIVRKLPESHGGRSSYADNQGPAVLALYAEEMLEHWDAEKMMKRIEKLPVSIEQQWMLAQARAAQADKDPAGKIKAYADFVAQVEGGQLVPRGYNLRLLASAYYKLGGAQLAAGDMEGLMTYGKLTALSPHYGEIHYNIGVTLLSMAESSLDPERRASLKRSARREFQQQMEWNFKGRPKDLLLECLRNVDALPDNPATVQRAKPTPLPSSATVEIK